MNNFNRLFKSYMKCIIGESEELHNYAIHVLNAPLNELKQIATGKNWESRDTYAFVVQNKNCPDEILRKYAEMCANENNDYLSLEYIVKNPNCSFETAKIAVDKAKQVGETDIISEFIKNKSFPAEARVGLLKEKLEKLTGGSQEIDEEASSKVFYFMNDVLFDCTDDKVAEGFLDFVENLDFDEDKSICWILGDISRSKNFGENVIERAKLEYDRRQKKY